MIKTKNITTLALAIDAVRYICGVIDMLTSVFVWSDDL